MPATYALLSAPPRPDNVLLSPAGDALVADFGLSRYVDLDGAAQTWPGTRPYVAPEVMQHRTISGKADVWSAGVLLHEMLTGSYRGVTADDVEAAGASWELPPRPDAVHPLMWALLRLMLQPDPACRPGSFSLLHSPEMSAAMLIRSSSPSTDTFSGLRSMKLVVGSVVAAALVFAAAALAWARTGERPPVPSRAGRPLSQAARAIDAALKVSGTVARVLFTMGGDWRTLI